MLPKYQYIKIYLKIQIFYISCDTSFKKYKFNSENVKRIFVNRGGGFLILISYSGNTEELRNIIQFANRNRIKIIGIASDPKSILLNASDIKIITPKIKESDPNNIVPILLIIFFSYLINFCISNRFSRDHLL